MAKGGARISLVKTTIEIIKYSFKCSPLMMGILILNSLISGVMGGSNVWVMQNLFDAVTKLGSGQLSLNEMIFPIVLFIFFLLGLQFFNSVAYYFMHNMGMRMHGYMCKKVAEKSAKLEPVLFESPEILDEINKASGATHLAFWAGNTVIVSLIFYLPFILITSLYLYHLNPLLILVIFLSGAPKVIGLGLRAKLYTNLEEKSASLRRQFTFYEEAIVDRQFLKETRMLGGFGFFKEKYLRSIHLLNRETWKADATAACFDLMTEVLTLLSYFGILFLLFSSLRNGMITVGAFAAVLASVNQLSQTIDELISYHFASIAEDLGKISYLIQLFELPEKTGEEVEINWKGDIEFKNVHFSYPNSIKTSMNNLSLTIKAGETVAIVGENGAGKSTFTKLLMGLYQPTSGQISVDGKSLENVMSQSLFNGVSAVFQDYQRYQLTLKENIQISHTEASEELFSIMDEAGVAWESRSYPEGIDTILSREFDGVDLSGGQWQRISIARGLYRFHDLIVLDEPTAAIDPLEESRLYEKFAEISKDKTAVIVTHRLGSAQIADKIIVLDNGRVVEIGTHQELMVNEGHYARMYEAQSSWYMS